MKTAPRPILVPRPKIGKRCPRPKELSHWSVWSDSFIISEFRLFLLHADRWDHIFGNLLVHILEPCMSEHTHEAEYTNNLWRLSSCQQCFCEQETTGIVYHRRTEWLIRSRPFLLEPVCFFIPHWDVHMPWHDLYLPPPPPPESLMHPRSSCTS